RERTVGTARLKEDFAGFDGSDAAKRRDSLDLRRSQHRVRIRIGRTRYPHFSTHVSVQLLKQSRCKRVADMESSLLVLLLCRCFLPSTMMIPHCATRIP